MSENPNFYSPRTRFFNGKIDTNLLAQIIHPIVLQEALESHLIFDAQRKAAVNDRLTFILDNGLTDFFINQILFFYGSLFLPDDKIDICDVGGGIGTFISKVTSLLQLKGRQVNGTMTNLVDFFQITGQALPPNIRQIITSAEFPPDELYERFNIVTSMNGPLQWSQNPELVAENLIDMTKSNGILLVLDEPNYHTGFTPSDVISHHPKIDNYIPWLGSNFSTCVAFKK